MLADLNWPGRDNFVIWSWQPSSDVAQWERETASQRDDSQVMLQVQDVQGCPESFPGPRG